MLVYFLFYTLVCLFRSFCESGLPYDPAGPVTQEQIGKMLSVSPITLVDKVGHIFSYTVFTCAFSHKISLMYCLICELFLPKCLTSLWSR